MSHRLLALGVNVAPRARPLRHAEDDARRVHEMLTGSRGWVTDDELLLREPPPTTRSSDALRAMAFAGWQPDQLTLYFSGHGNGAGIALADKVLPYQELGYWLGNIGARIKVLILDTCHAGSAARIFNERVAGFGGEALDAAWVQALDRAVPGLRIFAAVGAAEFAREAPMLRGSIFPRPCGCGRFASPPAISWSTATTSSPTSRRSARRDE